MKRNRKFIVMAGPCVIEDKKSTLESALYLKEAMERYSVRFIFKASFDKANRTALASYRGPGLAKGIKILEAVKKKTGLEIVSDVHCPHQIREVRDVLDVIQIPAFLSRQTDILIEAGKTKKTVNVKKAQFMAPGDIKYAIEKVESTGNKKIIITERGTSFGYNNLVVDFRSMLIMKELGYPVIYDVTHSLQRPSSLKGVSGGDRAFVLPMALAGVCCGCDGLFIETHSDPEKALCDAATSFSLSRVEELMEKVFKVREVTDDKEQ